MSLAIKVDTDKGSFTDIKVDAYKLIYIKFSYLNNFSQ